MSKIVETYFKVSSSTITILEGEHSGQTIDHFHAHLIPRIKGDLVNNNYIYTKLKYFDEE